MKIAEDTYERLYKVNKCLACMSDLTTNLVTFINCGHIFHKKCSTECKENKCPTCSEISNEIKPLQFDLDNEENTELWENYTKMKADYVIAKNDIEKAQKEVKTVATKLKGDIEKCNKLQYEIDQLKTKTDVEITQKTGELATAKQKAEEVHGECEFQNKVS